LAFGVIRHISRIVLQATADLRIGMALDAGRRTMPNKPMNNDARMSIRKLHAAAQGYKAGVAAKRFEGGIDHIADKRATDRAVLPV
jgi:hypothetical protein